MTEQIAEQNQDGAGDGRIPVTLLTGFLGAGKTTLLNRLVKDPAFAGTAVLINEFGAVGIDHHLVESLGETMVLLESGCICCTVRGDLVEALKDLHARLSRRQLDVRRVVIETTGLADPVPVVATLMQDRFVSTRFRCDGVITLVDASLGAEQMDRHGEARRQVALADRILITKPDLADRSKREALDARFAQLNPAAERITVSHGEIDPALVCGAGLYAVGGAPALVADWLGRADEPEASGGTSDGRAAEGAPHGAGVSSFTIHFDRPVPWRGFAVTLGAILAEHGPKLMRVKGLMNVAGLAGPVVVQCVEDVAYPPVRLPSWPAEKRRFDMRGRLVFITDGLDGAAADDIRARLAALPEDAAALRKVATTPLLPTKCWLSARIPVRGKGAFETEGFVVQPFRFGAATGRRAAAALAPQR